MQHFSDCKNASIISSFSSRRGAIYDASQVKSGAIYDAPQVRSGAIYDALQVRSGAICDALHVRSGAICDAPFGEPEKCCIKNCYKVVSLNKVLIILMLGSLLEVH